MLNLRSWNSQLRMFEFLSILKYIVFRHNLKIDKSFILSLNNFDWSIKSYYVIFNYQFFVDFMSNNYRDIQKWWRHAVRTCDFRNSALVVLENESIQTSIKSTVAKLRQKRFFPRMLERRAEKQTWASRYVPGVCPVTITSGAREIHVRLDGRT